VGVVAAPSHDRTSPAWSSLCGARCFCRFSRCGGQADPLSTPYSQVCRIWIHSIRRGPRSRGPGRRSSPCGHNHFTKALPLPVWDIRGASEPCLMAMLK